MLWNTSGLRQLVHDLEKQNFEMGSCAGSQESVMDALKYGAAELVDYLDGTSWKRRVYNFSWFGNNHGMMKSVGHVFNATVVGWLVKGDGATFSYHPNDKSM